MIATVHPLAGPAVDAHPDALLILDEAPPLTRRTSASAVNIAVAKTQLKAIYDTDSAAMLLPALVALEELTRSGNENVARSLVSGRAELLAAQDSAHGLGISLPGPDPLRLAWESARRAPRALTRGTRLHDAAETNFAAAVSTFRAVAVARAMASGRWRSDGSGVSVVGPTPEAEVIGSHKRIWLLDATADVEALLTRRADVRVVNVSAVTGPIGPARRRTIRFESRAAHALTDEAERPRAASLIAEALERAKRAGVRDLLIVTHKKTADALRAGSIGRAALRGWRRDGRELAIGHYHALRGLNDHAGVDGVVTIGDPWPALDDARDEAAMLGLADGNRRAERAARDELAQAHGRARGADAWHLHLGALPPTGWATADTVVEDGPRAQGLADLVEKLRGTKPAARALGCAPKSLRRYLNSERSVPREMLERAAKLLNDPGVVRASRGPISFERDLKRSAPQGDHRSR